MKIVMIIVLVLVALVALGFGYIYWQNSQVPTLGHSNGQLAPLSGNPNGVSTQTTATDAKVEPRPFKADQAATLEALKQSIAVYAEGNGEVEIVEEQADYLRVVFVTPKMRYRDDAEFYLDSEAGLVHFRSQSRAGKSDLGLNRQRHAKLTELYNRSSR